MKLNTAASLYFYMGFPYKEFYVHWLSITESYLLKKEFVKGCLYRADKPFKSIFDFLDHLLLVTPPPPSPPTPKYKLTLHTQK